MDKINLIKEQNGNVVIRNTFSGKILTSLSPAQIIQTGLDNSNSIIIKSYLAKENEKGLVINCNDIEVSMCVPAIIGYDRNSIIEALRKDFFFSLNGAGQKIIFIEHSGELPSDGVKDTLYISKLEKKIGYWHPQTSEYRFFEQIEYYYNLSNFPAQGVLGNLYLDLSSFEIYFYFGQYYKYKSGLQNLENNIISRTEVIRTFYFDIPFGFNNRIDLQFPFGDISGITSLKLTSNESLGSLHKQFSFESAIDINKLNYYKTKNGSVINTDIFSELGIGEAIIKLDSSVGLKRVTIPLIKRVEKAINQLKLEVKFENPNPLNGLLESFLNVMSISSAYISTSPPIPFNYETIGIIPVGNRFNKNYKQLAVDPNSGAMWQSNQNYTNIRIAKKIVTNITDPLNSKYIGVENEITDTLNIVDVSGTSINSKTLFSNIITATYENLKIVNGKIFCSDNNVRIIFKYLVSNSGNPTHYTNGSQIHQFDLVKGWNDLIFPDSLQFDATAGQFVIMEVQSMIQSTRNVIIYGGINCLN